MSSTARRGRPRSILACTVCRVRKIKCDFLTADDNICTPCRAAGIRCAVTRKDDRKGDHAQDEIVGIRESLQSLESMLRRTDRQARISLESSPQKAKPSSLEDQGTDIRGRGSGHPPSSNKHPQAQSQENPVPSIECQLITSSVSSGVVVQDSPVTGLVDLASFESLAMPFPLSINSAALEPTTEADPQEEEEKPLFHLDPERRQVSYYGPTSQNYHSSPCADRTFQGEDGTIDNPGTAIDIDSPHIKRVILDCFWKSNEVFGRAVDKELFTAAHKAGEPSEYYSKALEDVMLACGARNSTSAVIRKLGPRYVKRAKAGLLMQLESPTIGSIQGFMLLSNFDSSLGSHRVGWTYGGIAFLLLVDLGLHEDCSHLVMEGKLTEAEAQCRKNLLYSAFIYETVGAWFLGRPRQIPISAVSLNFPTSKIGDPADTATVAFHGWVQLSIQTAFVADILNDALPLDDQAVQQLSQLYTTIQSFQDSLPPGVKWEDSEMLPLDSSAYALNAQVAALQVILHRIPTRCRAASRGLDTLENQPVTLSGFTSDLSKRICYNNALRIAQLVRMCVQIHGIENIAPTMLDNMFVAAMVLIRRTLESDAQDWWPARDRPWLVVLSDALEGVQKHFPMAYRIRFRLSHAVENTSMADIFSLEKGGENWAGGDRLRPLTPPFPVLGSDEDLFMGDFLMDSTV